MEEMQMLSRQSEGVWCVIEVELSNSAVNSYLAE
jgi:hypothetical protein